MGNFALEKSPEWEDIQEAIKIKAEGRAHSKDIPMSSIPKAVKRKSFRLDVIPVGRYDGKDDVFWDPPSEAAEDLAIRDASKRRRRVAGLKEKSEKELVVYDEDSASLRRLGAIFKAQITEALEESGKHYNKRRKLEPQGNESAVKTEVDEDELQLQDFGNAAKMPEVLKPEILQPTVSKKRPWTDVIPKHRYQEEVVFCDDPATTGDVRRAVSKKRKVDDIVEEGPEKESGTEVASLKRLGGNYNFKNVIKTTETPFVPTVKFMNNIGSKYRVDSQVPSNSTMYGSRHKMQPQQTAETPAVPTVKSRNITSKDKVNSLVHSHGNMHGNRRKIQLQQTTETPIAPIAEFINIASKNKINSRARPNITMPVSRHKMQPEQSFRGKLKYD
ncbi:hypothetical protein RUND412_001285 [Rhizina undulata]